MKVQCFRVSRRHRRRETSSSFRQKRSWRICWRLGVFWYFMGFSNMDGHLDKYSIEKFQWMVSWTYLCQKYTSMTFSWFLDILGMRAWHPLVRHPASAVGKEVGLKDGNRNLQQLQRKRREWPKQFERRSSPGERGDWDRAIHGTGSEIQDQGTFARKRLKLDSTTNDKKSLAWFWLGMVWGCIFFNTGWGISKKDAADPRIVEVNNSGRPVLANGAPVVQQSCKFASLVRWAMTKERGKQCELYELWTRCYAANCVLVGPSARGQPASDRGGRSGGSNG